MQSHLAQSRGSLVSEILAGSWRSSQPALLNFSESQLDEVTPLLYGSGAAALGWWRVRGTGLSSTLSAELLKQAYRLLSLQSAIHEEQIEKIFRLFRTSGIEPILMKGWAAAGLYPERGLRPYGDIDLVVRPGDYEQARALLANPEAKDCWVDLHRSVSELADRPLDQLFERSQTVSLGAESVRLLSAEDHLALLAVHLLKHGAWRPLWLCDIGAAIESLSPDFDWNICLGQNRIRADWIACAIGLAHHLLSARTDEVALGAATKRIPNWLIQNVRKQWEQPFARNQAPMNHPVPMSSVLRHPSRLPAALGQRWPNPILATVSVNGQFNSFPRLPYQLGNCLVRSVSFFFHASENG
jgi:hypothetical protein